MNKNEVMMLYRTFHRLFLTILLSILSSTVVLSGQIAITEYGKQVLLKDDGTWEYVKREPKKEDLYDFRKTNWGMSKKQVKKTEEGKVLKENEDLLLFQGKVAGLDCFIIYFFAEGKLARSKYLFSQTHTNKNDFISDYRSLKKILTEKYGKPTKDSEYWKNDLYRDDYQDWGFAISLGHLSYFVDWETSSTEMCLGLYGENYDITLGIEYVSKKLRKLEEKVQQNKVLDEF